MHLLYRIITRLLVSLCFVTTAWAETLPPQEAFSAQITSVTPQQITIGIAIPKGYYLYRNVRFAVNSPNLSVTGVEKSPGSVKNDAFFGEQSIWYGGKDSAEATVTFENPQQLQTGEFLLEYQGCQDGVICYPPQKVPLTVDLPESTQIGGKNGLSSAKKKALFGSGGTGKKTLSSLIENTADETDLLSEDEAFAPTLTPLDATTLALRFSVAEGYYLYRDKIKVTVEALDANKKDSLLSDIQFLHGDSHTDEFYGEQAVYRGDQTVANLYLLRPEKDLSVTLQFQGCAEGRICYPVMRRTVEISNGEVAAVTTTPANTPKALDKLAKALAGNLWVGVGLLLVAGIALSFTPCVLPMLPILLGIITNQRKVSRAKAFALSLAYALGVATMMAIFGLVVAKTGVNIQIIFQQPLWLILFATLFILMGLAMLGIFSIAMPGSVQSKVIAWQNRFQNTNVFSVFVVGALSTLIVGPCVAPPLIAVLAFISTTGDSLQGALYLFALGLGMSLPLVVFASLVTTIPKTGALSRLVTRLFAMLMFAVGLWLLGRLLPGAVNLVLWGVFMGALAWLFVRSGLVQPYARMLTTALTMASLIIGASWTVGGFMGNSNPLKPFTKVDKLPFQAVVDMDSLQTALRQSQKPVMLDLYADWCVSCQEVEHFTLTDPAVIDKLKAFTLLKLDITETDDAQRELLKHYELIGPPVMLFFADGVELRDYRHVGAISAQELTETLDKIEPENNE